MSAFEVEVYLGDVWVEAIYRAGVLGVRFEVQAEPTVPAVSR